MRITVSIGPGQHGGSLCGALSRGGILHRTIRAWPHFLVEACGTDGFTPRPVAKALWYDGFRWLAWAIWRRLPWLGHYETPRAPFCTLFDLLAQRYLDGCDLFVGWSQVSLWSLRRAKREGATTILEHPMSHVDTWMRLVREEYGRWGESGGGYYGLFPSSLVRRMKREYEEAEFISVLSSFSRRTFLDAGVPKEKLIQIPLGVDPDLFYPGQPNDGPLRILYVGRLELLKGVQYLLQAFSELNLSGAELVLVGPVLPEIRPVLARYTTDRIRVVGEVPHEQVPAYYRRADVLVFPSVNDAFGLVILEAMACGLPVIATEHSAGPDVIEDGIHGFIVPIRDVEALKERIQYLFDHREEARAMGSAGRNRVLDRFTSDRYGEWLLKTYQGIVAGESQQQPRNT